jgi:hypothetical protein
VDAGQSRDGAGWPARSSPPRRRLDADAERGEQEGAVEALGVHALDAGVAVAVLGPPTSIRRRP